MKDPIPLVGAAVLPARAAMTPDPTPGLYRHYKGGRYLVRGLAVHTETDEQMVIYEDADTGEAFVRPVTMFTEIVEVDDQRVPRFVRMRGQKP